MKEHAKKYVKNYDLIFDNSREAQKLNEVHLTGITCPASAPVPRLGQLFFLVCFAMMSDVTS